MKIIFIAIIMLIPLISKGQGINADYYDNGRLDAKLYYHDTNFGKGFVIGLGTIFTLPFEIWHISTKPKIQNLMFGNPNANLLSNDDYYKGYSSFAHRRKSELSFFGYLVGFATAAILISIFTYVLVSH